MKRGVTALMVILLAAVPGQSQRVRDRYTSKEGQFAIRFPGMPRESNKTARSGIGDLAVVSATYANSDGNTFLVSFTDFPDGSTRPENHATLFDGIRDGLKGKDGKLQAEKAIELGTEKYPGRDYEFELDNGKKRMKCRAVLREHRLYQIAVIGSAGFVTGKDAAAFFDSFELTK